MSIMPIANNFHQENANNIIAVQVRWKKPEPSVVTTEAISMRNGLNFASSLGFTRMEAESDSLIVIESCDGQTRWWDEIAAIFAECVDISFLIGKPAADGTKVKVPAGEGKATTVEQKFIEKVNQAFKKALDAANAAAPDDKFSVFDAAFNREIKQCLAGMSAKFIAMIDRAFKIAYNSAVAATNAQEKFSCLVLTLTEALRFIAATLDAHAIKPAIEEVVAGGMKATAGATQVIKKLDKVIKLASAAAKEAPKADRILVFQAALNKAIKDQMGPGYDGSKTTSDLDAAFKKAVDSAATSKPEAKDTDLYSKEIHYLFLG
ncbi:Major pollen allergen Lol p 5a [Triticum urartu]|uniref:Major pollen allergen Lol p 5a n=1 Tax=Triticum urartu TaxID=4572 RepID=M7YYH3_TRIUA|nr:Major pollen allergen Lol p 5a [Triticum urartu]